MGKGKGKWKEGL